MRFPIVVLDIGGTLMEYRGMPYVWIDFYPTALRHVREKLALPLSDDALARSAEILREFNPRVRYREIDYTPAHIFSAATAHWDCAFSLTDVIRIFFETLHLTPRIYPDTLPALEALHTRGVKLCALTDVPTGMPDALHRSYIPKLLPFFDLYVSSESCGFRKPNRHGLDTIAAHFGVSAETLLLAGDEEKDVRAAQNAGCTAVLVDRARTRRDFGQTRTFSDMRALADFLLEELP